ncbi:MAG: flagellar export chaperone FliS [Planctomycetota bacterium]
MSKPIQPNTNAYLRTQVLSASAEELRMMLIDGAIKFTRQGRDGIASGNHEGSYEGFSQARAILSELMTSMRTEVAPELCERVRSLYSYMYNQLVSASMDRDQAKADEVLELLGYERETWQLLMESLKSQPSQPASSPQSASPESGAAPAGYRPLSVQG